MTCFCKSRGSSYRSSVIKSICNVNFTVCVGIPFNRILVNLPVSNCSYIIFGHYKCIGACVSFSVNFPSYKGVTDLCGILNPSDIITGSYCGSGFSSVYIPGKNNFVLCIRCCKLKIFSRHCCRNCSSPTCEYVSGLIFSGLCVDSFTVFVCFFNVEITVTVGIPFYSIALNVPFCLIGNVSCTHNGVICKFFPACELITHSGRNFRKLIYNVAVAFVGGLCC